MLSRLETQNLGLVSPLTIEFPERLSVIIGDNGLGKSLLLEIAWSILTQSWYDGKPLLPNSWSPNLETRISGTLGLANTEENTFNCIYEQTGKAWHIEKSPKQRPGIVIFVGTDGRYAVWDKMRNSYEEDTLFYRKRTAKEGLEGESEEPAAFIFERSQLWNGLKSGDSVICNGLLRDWGEWQLESLNTEQLIGNTVMGAPLVFKTLSKVLEKLSPPGETIIPGEPKRFSFGSVNQTVSLGLLVTHN